MARHALRFEAGKYFPEIELRVWHDAMPVAPLGTLYAGVAAAAGLGVVETVGDGLVLADGTEVTWSRSRLEGCEVEVVAARRGELPTPRTILTRSGSSPPPAVLA